MKTRLIARWLVPIPCLLVLSIRPPVPVGAAPPSKVTVVGPVVVTADKIEESLSNVASSLTLITRDDIERRKAQTVQEMLREVPGVDLQSSGGSPGSFTQVRIRGANDDQLVVLVDGARVNGTFGGNFDFGLMPTDNVERIEVLRGGASALYGSDAIGGVINIITRRGKEEPRVSLFWEGGSLETFKEGVSAGGVWKGNDFSFTYSRLDSAGLRPGPFNHSHERVNNWSVLVGRDFGPEDDRLGRFQSTLNVSQEDLQLPYDFPFGFDFFAVPAGIPPALETYDPNNEQGRLFITTTSTLDLKPTDWWATTLRFSLTQNEQHS
ncbi:MAG: TonB-dependent receptor, partial [Vicinamibacteria bacterium]